MFEFSVASKYLTPRWRQLSVSIISMVSILVIALVVWLIVVFFSVTDGLEKSWIQKLIALTAPVRITPTDAYYNSYYYKIDSISANSDYTLKSIGDKLRSSLTDPYDPSSDEEIPLNWKEADRTEDGSLKDIVKKTFGVASSLKVPGLHLHDFEMTVGNLRLRMAKEKGTQEANSSFLSQTAYLGSFDQGNLGFKQALLPVTAADVRNVLEMITTDSGNIQEDVQEILRPLDQSLIRERLTNFFKYAKVTALKTPPQGWVIPHKFLPNPSFFYACAIVVNQQIKRIVIPQTSQSLPLLKKSLEDQGFSVKAGKATIAGDAVMFEEDGTQHISPLPLHAPIVIAGDISSPATLVEDSLEKARTAGDLRFEIALNLQGIILKGAVPLHKFILDKVDFTTQFKTQPENPPYWLYFTPDNKGNLEMKIPSDPFGGDGILLPRSFRDAGALLGDRGFISYYAASLSSMQEQRIPVYVAGFYDPGIIPVGGKYVLANQEVVSLVRSSQQQENSLLTNGIHVRFDDLTQVDTVKADLLAALKKEGLEKYWKIETYREFDFTKDLIQQLSSEKNLWSLIATIIIIVACSNIISMLIILVNDKKTEIGILRAMGASSRSIALIFGFCGVFMGLIGSFLGTLVAIFTLRHLHALLDLISKLQGHEVFNPLFYGHALPNSISYDALLFVIMATTLISILAGIVPAVKASLIRPSAILKSE